MKYKMKFKFWNRKVKEIEDPQIKDLQETTTDIHTQVENLSDQVKKMTRMQFKSSKNMEEKIDHLGSVLAVQSKQHDLIDRYEKQQASFMGNMIELRDELDHVSSGIKESERAWQVLLDQWSKTIEKILREIGVYELHVIGQTFNPEVAESLQTVARDSLHVPPEVPYQIVAVIKRGYVSENGQLIRKAKVVTVEEENSNDKE